MAARLTPRNQSHFINWGKAWSRTRDGHAHRPRNRRLTSRGRCAFYAVLGLLALCWGVGTAQASQRAAERQQSLLEAEGRGTAMGIAALRPALAKQRRLAAGLPPLNTRDGVELVVRRAFAIEGKPWGEQEVDAMLRLCWRESNYDHTSKNPVSSAYGLWQFIDATWADTKIRRTDDPILQTVAAIRYIEPRYGTPTAALAFHRRVGSY